MPEKNSVKSKKPTKKASKKRAKKKTSKKAIKSFKVEYQNLIRIKKAKDGDTSAAKEVLELFCKEIRRRSEKGPLKANSLGISVSYYAYFLESFETILEQLRNNEKLDANKALNLTTNKRGRRKWPKDFKRDEDIFWKILDKKNQEGKLINEAIHDVHKEENLSQHTVTKIWEKMKKLWLADELN